MRIHGAAQLDAVDFDPGGGLVPVIAQHAYTGEVLMLAFADRAALERTLAEQRMCYFSRSRNRLWVKGESSGNHQRLVALHADCDADSILALVLPEGPSCHTGARTCFSAAPTLRALAAAIDARARDPKPGSYTNRLLGDENLRLKKLGEEVVELTLACTAGDAARAAQEAADLIYHALVACSASGVTLEDVLAVLHDRRSAPPPHDEPVEREQNDRTQDRDSQ